MLQDLEHLPLLLLRSFVCFLKWRHLRSSSYGFYKIYFGTSLMSPSKAPIWTEVTEAKRPGMGMVTGKSGPSPPLCVSALLSQEENTLDFIFYFSVAKIFWDVSKRRRMGELFNIQVLEDRWCEKWSPGEGWALLFLFFLVSVVGGVDPPTFLGSFFLVSVL